MATLSAVPPKPKGDPILHIMELFQADPRPDKIDLSDGVYKTEDGRTPVLAAVKEAERRLLAVEQTKSYLGLAGNTGFSTPENIGFIMAYGQCHDFYSWVHTGTDTRELIGQLVAARNTHVQDNDVG